MRTRRMIKLSPLVSPSSVYISILCPQHHSAGIHYFLFLAMFYSVAMTALVEGFP